MKWAEFPQYLTLDQFKLSEQSAIGDKQLNVLKELSWIEDHFTLIMMGPTGVGKTHLSTGLCKLRLSGIVCPDGAPGVHIEKPGVYQQVAYPV